MKKFSTAVFAKSPDPFLGFLQTLKLLFLTTFFALMVLPAGAEPDEAESKAISPADRCEIFFGNQNGNPAALSSNFRIHVSEMPENLRQKGKIDETALNEELARLIQHSGMYPQMVGLHGIAKKRDRMVFGIPINIAIAHEFRLAVEYEIVPGVQGDPRRPKRAKLVKVELHGRLSDEQEVRIPVLRWTHQFIANGPEFPFSINLNAINQSKALKHLSEEDLRKLKSELTEISIYKSISGPLIDRYFEALHILTEYRGLSQEQIATIRNYAQLENFIENRILSRGEVPYSYRSTAFKRVVIKTTEHDSQNTASDTSALSDRELLVKMARALGFTRKINSATLKTKSEFELTYPLVINGSSDYRLVAFYRVDKPVFASGEDITPQPRTARLAELYIEFKKDDGKVVRARLRPERYRSTNAKEAGVDYLLDLTDAPPKDTLRFFPPEVTEEMVKATLKIDIESEIRGSVVDKFFRLVTPFTMTGGSSTQVEINEIANLQNAGSRFGYAGFYTAFLRARTKNFWIGTFLRGLNYRFVIGSAVLVGGGLLVYALGPERSSELPEGAKRLLYIPSDPREKVVITQDQAELFDELNSVGTVQRVFINDVEYPYLVDVERRNFTMKLVPLEGIGIEYPKFDENQAETQVHILNGGSYKFNINKRTGVLTFDPIPDALDGE